MSRAESASPAGQSAPQQWEGSYRAARHDWREIVERSRDAAQEELDGWSRRAELMRTRQHELEAGNMWRSGPRTLLAAVGVQYRELAMTAGLAWLLRPDGHHGLGTRVLNGFLTHLTIADAVEPREVEVVLEDPRKETRADLVVYSPQWTIVVEAKTFAMEQPRQLERLHHRWSDDPVPTFVYLTRDRREAVSAATTADAWKSLTWAEVARIARISMSSSDNPAPGVYDYLSTLEAYHRA